MGIRAWFHPDLASQDGAAGREILNVAAALVVCAGEVLDIDDEQQLLQHYCDQLTARVPNLRLAWIWFGNPDTRMIVPQVRAGAARAYAERLCIARSPVTERGPAYRALQGQRSEPYRISTLSVFGPWREMAREHGMQEALALPLQSSVDAQRGVLVLYADAPGYFERVGLPLFEAMAGLFSSALSRAARHKALQNAVTVDALTGLMNRHAVPALQRQLLRADETAPPASVLLLDIDHFKSVNDLHGHAAGDDVLRATAQTLRVGVRSGDLLMRWGGEEILLGLPGANAEAAWAVAESLRQQVATVRHVKADGQLFSVTVSIGVASLLPAESLDQAVQRADAALYAAKRGGRNRSVLA